MLGYVIQYIFSTGDSDYSEPIFTESSLDDWKDWLNKQYDDIKRIKSSQDAKFYLYKNEYWGNLEEYDWNDTFSKQEISSSDEFYDVWKPETAKLIERD